MQPTLQFVRKLAEKAGSITLTRNINIIKEAKDSEKNDVQTNLDVDVETFIVETVQKKISQS